MGKVKNKCGAAKYKGDKNCDDENNNCGCDYDGGDCCDKSVVGGVVDKKFCKACKCLDPKYAPKTPAPKTPAPGCDNDGGDCCDKSVVGGVVGKKFCKACKCLDPKYAPKTPAPKTPAPACDKVKNKCGAAKYKGDKN